ncbi:MAG: imidazole glycerol phosphate synthase subunit HisH [Neomegalonema sp.]|nr:imidazole glycerol phosphate synthase subunit HisH [Neomegalonema sp.]
MSEKIVIIDYGSGNLHSVQKAFQRGAAAKGHSVVVSADPAAVSAADRVVLPGVGAFGDCRAGLEAVSGMREALHARVIEQGVPFFGICVGMQLMAERGLERGSHDGLGWLGGDVVHLTPQDPGLKVPHMGWNALGSVASHPVFRDVPTGRHVYFVHSYHMKTTDPSQTLASVDYGGPVTAAVGRDNLFGTQFHPEKSQHVGAKIIENFLEWRP